MIEFEPYHIHTSYSNCLTQQDSTMSIKDYADVFRERGHKVLCISEHGNRSNVWEQFSICEAFQSDKKNPYHMTPLAAAEAYFVPDRMSETEGQKDKRNFHLILIAKNMEGFYQLNEILSEANLTGYYYHARVDFDLLSKLNPQNFLCTTACVGGIMKDDEHYEELACQLAEIFGKSFYLEVQNHPQEIQKKTNQRVLDLYKKYGWPLIYGTDSHYIYPEEQQLRQELLLSSQITYGSEDEFLLDFPTAEESVKRFQEQGILSRAQIGEAMENTLILREFEGLSFDRNKKIPNIYPDLPDEKRKALYKKTVCYDYLDKAGMPDEQQAKEIHAEMDTIVDTDTEDYFMTMKQIVDKGREYGGILTTTGRGSGASYCSNYALGFTSINRLKSPVKMLPERFISADRLANGLPDSQTRVALCSNAYRKPRISGKVLRALTTKHS